MLGEVRGGEAFDLLQALNTGHGGSVSTIHANSAGQALARLTSYMKNIIEQDYRFIKKRITARLGFRSVDGAWRTIQGYEAMHAIRKGQIRWLAKTDSVGQRDFMRTLFGLAA